jgi:hypothetical protein
MSDAVPRLLGASSRSRVVHSTLPEASHRSSSQRSRDRRDLDAFQCEVRIERRHVPSVGVASGQVGAAVGCEGVALDFSATGFAFVDVASRRTSLASA